jgi:hypothetical protein
MMMVSLQIDLRLMVEFKENFMKVLVALALLFTMSAVKAEWKKHLDEKTGITFEWKVNGENLDVKLSAKTKGWIGIGFIPKSKRKKGAKMKGVNIFIGYVKNGKAVIEDHYGKGPTKHKVDSKKNKAGELTNIAGSEAGGVTNLSFTYPLKGKHKKKDTDIVTNEKMVVLTAVGSADNVKGMHHSRNTFEIQL